MFSVSLVKHSGGGEVQMEKCLTGQKVCVRVCVRCKRERLERAWGVAVFRLFINGDRNGLIREYYTERLLVCCEAQTV